jgi:caffeoyl-CoA O-methyltransferase
MSEPIVREDVEQYAEAHSTPPADAVLRLADETRQTTEAPGMMVGALEGGFLQMLVYALRPKLVLEIGTFTGYSSISMAPALPPGGRIVTCDINETTQAVARRYAEEAGVADRIEYRLGPALETIASLEGPFDFVFIDADKTNYRNYYEAVLPKLSEHGLVAADNTLWYGQVLDESDRSDNTVALRQFNDFVASDERVVCVQLTVRDGVTLIRKR